MSWIEVGWCFNIDNSLLDSWIEFSKKSTKYEDGECENLWSGMKKHNLGSRVYVDGQGLTIQVNLKNIGVLILKTILKGTSCTSYHVAKVLYQMYRYQFICGSLKYKTGMNTEIIDGIK